MMKPRERLEAVLHRQKPDRVPFAPYDEMVPRGDFVRELRNRGMCLWTFHTRDYWSECPNVTVETRVHQGRTSTIYHTPVGSVSGARRTQLSRSITRGRSIESEGLIKDVEDYGPVMFLIDDEMFHPDYEVYHWISRDLGDDGHVRIQGFADPYSAAQGYFGRGTPDGMANYVYHQRDHPQHFARLLEALERRNERLFPILAGSPAEVICLGSVNGAYGPQQYEAYILPFYEKYVPLLHQQGKILYNHAHSSQLRSYVDLLRRTGLDMIDAFTPPPIGNLSVREARAAWGGDVIISVNFPETLFWHGPQATKDYSMDLLHQDPEGPLIITMTEMGTSMVADDRTEEAYKSGMRAIMDSIDEFSA